MMKTTTEVKDRKMKDRSLKSKGQVRRKRRSSARMKMSHARPKGPRLLLRPSWMQSLRKLLRRMRTRRH